MSEYRGQPELNGGAAPVASHRDPCVGIGGSRHARKLRLRRGRLHAGAGYVQAGIGEKSCQESDLLKSRWFRRAKNAWARGIVHRKNPSSICPGDPVTVQKTSWSLHRIATVKPANGKATGGLLASQNLRLQTNLVTSPEALIAELVLQLRSISIQAFRRAEKALGSWNERFMAPIQHISAFLSGLEKFFLALRIDIFFRFDISLTHFRG
jgi:hypothetical protein